MSTPSISTRSVTAEDKLYWEVEKLRREVRNLGRSFAVAVVLAIAGAVTSAYNIIKAFTDVSSFQEAKTNLQQEIAGLTQQREIATSQLSSFRSAVAALQENSSLTPQQKLDSLPSIEPTLQYAAPDQVSHSSLPARIYLQYLFSDKSYVGDVVAQLQRAHYQVRALGVTASPRTRTPVVAYYFPEDSAEAKELINLLQRIGVPRVQPTPVRLNGSARPRHFDLWLPRAGV